MKVAKHRASSVYCNAIEKIVLAQIYQLVKTEGEGDDVSKLKNGNDDKEHVCMDEGVDEDEDGSEISMDSEGTAGNCDENSDNRETIQTSEDNSDGEYEDDGMDEDGYDEDSEYECA